MEEELEQLTEGIIDTISKDFADYNDDNPDITQEDEKWLEEYQMSQSVKEVDKRSEFSCQKSWASNTFLPQQWALNKQAKCYLNLLPRALLNRQECFSFMCQSPCCSKRASENSVKNGKPDLSLWEKQLMSLGESAVPPQYVKNLFKKAIQFSPCVLPAPVYVPPTLFNKDTEFSIGEMISRRDSLPPLPKSKIRVKPTGKTAQGLEIVGNEGNQRNETSTVAKWSQAPPWNRDRIEYQRKAEAYAISDECENAIVSKLNSFSSSKRMTYARFFDILVSK